MKTRLLEKEYIDLIIKSIEHAAYLYEEYMKSEKFLTRNGAGGTQWDFINRELVENFDSRFQVEFPFSGAWQFSLLYDRATETIYSLMRKNNLTLLRKKSDSKQFHYINALAMVNKSTYENKDIVNEQLSLDIGQMESQVSEEKLEKSLAEKIKNIDGEIKKYVLITFDTINGHVAEIKGIVPWPGMNYVDEENWTELLSADYDTEKFSSENIFDEQKMAAQKNSNINLRRRNKKKIKTEKHM